MPVFYDAVNFVRKLDEETWVILKKILLLSRYYEKIPISKVIQSTRLSEKVVFKRVESLHKKGFIEYFKQPYLSVRLLTLGLDLIALKKLTDRNLIIGVGRQIGTGKESDIYEVITPEKRLLSLKVFRLGRISFRSVRVKREYGPRDKKTTWLLRNIYAAKKEFMNLKYAYRKGVSVPRPIYRVLHMILMEKLDGYLLNDLKEVQNPSRLFQSIIYEIKKAYDSGIVNGDLSQFNIFVSNNGRIYLIDWPQAVSADNPRFIFLLRRDLNNIILFFKKKYNLSDPHISKILEIYDFSEFL